MKTIILSCSEKQDNLSIRCAKAINSYLPEAEIIDLREFHLNIFGTADAETQANLSKLTETFSQANQVIIISPEYNWGLSPNAKNLIDYLSGNTDIWSNKVFMCFGCSAGRGGRLPIIELWKTINKIISLSHACSIVSPYHIEITSNLLDENNQFIENFKPTAQQVFDNHKKLVSKFQID
ncbi:MAG: NADPH-dependent FMN reductase [Candidatus Melainabacteria bacterium]|jgi:NAD(P)H-dependent FMN reductase